MSAVDTIDILNRLSVMHNRSLAVYLHYAIPWVKRGREDAAAVLAQLASDHERTVDRLGAMILESKGDVISGEFPMMFTAWHDLSVDFLLAKLITFQEQLVAQLEISADELRLAPATQSVVQEILGEAKGHLDNLNQIAA